MNSHEFDTQAELQEETQAARGRTLELLLSVVLISALLGLAVSLGSTLLAQKLTYLQIILVIIGSTAASALALFTLIPRITTTVREFHNELEILVPLLVSSTDVEVLRLKHYGAVTDVVQPALARRPSAEREKIAATIQRLASGTGRADVAAFALELVQFLIAVKVVQDSRSMLGQDAIYSKLRSVAFAQPSVVLGEWSKLASHSPHNRYMSVSTQGVPGKTVLPERITLSVPDVAAQVPDKLKARKRWQPSTQYVTLLTADSGHDTALRVLALVDTSEHGLPTANAPHRGRVARRIMLDAQDKSIRALATDEARLARELNDRGESAGHADTVQHYAELVQRLYSGGQRPHLLRVFIRLEGSFRIRLLSSERRQRGHYAWGVAISRLLSQIDIDAYLKRLRESGRTFPADSDHS